MKVNVTILVENTTPIPGFYGEYGFAALVTVGEQTYLFDTGSADALFKNAAAGGIDLSLINDLIISHGHFDHTGALISFLKTGPKKIYAHSNMFIPRYVVLGEFKKGIGVSFSPQEIKAQGAEFISTDGFTEIGPGVFVTGQIPRKNDYEDVGGSFYVYAGEQLVPDAITDDMSMVINHPEGLIIISGCAHAGIINTITYAQEKTGQKQVLAFIGGTHLIGASEDRMNRTVEALQAMELGKLVACHCTGFDALVKLRNALGDKLVKGETAMNFQF